MNQTPQTQHDDIIGVSILDMLIILLENRWLITKITLLFFVISVIYAITATPLYKSTIEITPPSTQSGVDMSRLASQSGLGYVINSSNTLNMNSDMIVGIMKSNVVLDGVITKLDLRHRIPERSAIMKIIHPQSKSNKELELYKVRSSLFEAVTSTVDKRSNLITVSVKDTSPDMAVKLAEGVFDETQSTLLKLSDTAATQQREFFEKQLKQSREALAKAAIDLEAFKNNNRTNVDYTKQSQYQELLRQYNFRNSMVKAIMNQYEAAKLNEIQSPQIIQILSRPTIPEHKDSPQGMKTCAIVSLFGLFIGIFAAFTHHFLSISSKDPDVALKFALVRNILFGWFKRSTSEKSNKRS